MPQTIPDWPETRVVARLPGSLPLGGVIPATPIHAFATPAARLDWAAGDCGLAQRHDIELGGLLAFSIDDVVSAKEADSLIAASEHFGFRDAAPGIATPPGMRVNTSVHWVADETMLDTLYRRIADLLPARIDGARLHPQLSHRLNVYRYRQGDAFNLHIDGDWPGYGLSDDRAEMVEWSGLRSKLTMLLYLNDPSDGVEGGKTRLYRPDKSFVDVTPKKGAALFFRHGMQPGSVLHEGRPIIGETPKYVVRINVLYTD